MARILVIEDSRDVALGLRRNLEAGGHHVYVALTGPTGLGVARRAAPDLVVLDLLLPGMNGLELLAELRTEGLGMPVLILSAVDTEDDKVRGFELGADDYLTKPFSLRELLVRVTTLLRRRALPESLGAVYRLGSLVIDTLRHQVSKRGRMVALRPKEYALLVALARRHGGVASRTELMTEVWGYAADAVSRTLDAHVVMLRRKIESDRARPRYLLTVRNVGYRLAP